MHPATSSLQSDRRKYNWQAHSRVGFWAWLWAAFLLVITLCISTYAQSQAPQTASSDLPPGEGKAVVQRACTTCHTSGTISRKRATAAEWSATVDEMVNRGAELSDEEIVTVGRYLAASFPATPNPNTTTTPTVH
ncbi:hypothetical protein SAMN05444167_1277 [Terriglobus roseus]|uniref:Quinohemoprotein amine dehydrogenase alpha subunit haem binding domain-containing protein n=1 Tax=Terriglobus roseus TaxID=392734 RepID=A0A1G7I099_9BACT|nr:hypothetical protein SAMN05444167_1277 [Terriglobus roseus]